MSKARLPAGKGTIAKEAFTECADLRVDLALTAGDHESAGMVLPGEVPEVLFHSRRTVEAHVSHILAKLGLRSRTELVLSWRDVLATLTPDRGDRAPSGRLPHSFSLAPAASSQPLLGGLPR